MTTNTATSTDNNFERSVRYADMSVAELVTEAKKLNVKLQTTNRDEIIKLLLEQSINETSEAVRPGVLIPLHSQTEEAVELIKIGRDRILEREQANLPMVQTFRARQTGERFKQRLPGVELTAETFAKFTKIAQPFDAGQQALIDEALASPENFQNIALVRVVRQNKIPNAERKWVHYLMLYIEPKTPDENIVDSKF